MSYFKDSQDLEKVLGGFFQELTQEPKIGEKLKNSKLIIRFSYTEPSLTLTIDCSQDPIKILANDTTLKPEVEMSMKADTAHRFWFGKVNLLAALTRREMVAKGPIPKVLKLLPVIKPAYDLYPKYLEKQGLDSLKI